jgi:hypothetical protein
MVTVLLEEEAPVIVIEVFGFELAPTGQKVAVPGGLIG